jgi:transcriptional regulator with XRE-family HTH domain
MTQIEKPHLRLQRLREARGWTRGDLAKKAGLGMQVITQLETEPRRYENELLGVFHGPNRWDNKKPQTYTKLAVALGVTPHFLKHGREEPALHTDDRVVHLAAEIEDLKSEIVRLRKALARIHEISGSQ